MPPPRLPRTSAEERSRARRDTRDLAAAYGLSDQGRLMLATLKIESARGATIAIPDGSPKALAAAQEVAAAGLADLTYYHVARDVYAHVVRIDTRQLSALAAAYRAVQAAGEVQR